MHTDAITSKIFILKPLSTVGRIAFGNVTEKNRTFPDHFPFFFRMNHQDFGTEEREAFFHKLPQRGTILANASSEHNRVRASENSSHSANFPAQAMSVNLVCKLRAGIRR